MNTPKQSNTPLPFEFPEEQINPSTNTAETNNSSNAIQSNSPNVADYPPMSEAEVAEARRNLVNNRRALHDRLALFNNTASVSSADQFQPISTRGFR